MTQFNFVSLCRTSALAVIYSALVFTTSMVFGADPVPEPFDVKAKYTKYEYRIPMRDGKRLFTDVYIPKDQSQKYPILMTRTPYSVKPYGADQYKESLGPSQLFDKSGYI